MPFTSYMRLIWPESPGKLYVHTTGITVFGKTLQEQIENAADHFGQVFSAPKGIDPDLLHVDYWLAALWGQHNGNRMVDLFTYSDIQPWHGNADVRSFIFCNGVYQPPEDHDYVFGCEDFEIVRGREGELRRNSPNLEAFIRGKAHLPASVTTKPFTVVPLPQP